MGGTFWILEFSHPFGDSAVRWSGVLVNIIQLLANFDGIQPFSGEKLYDCSMLNVRHFSKMKTHGPQNIFFSYDGNEPIGPKLVYLNQDPPSIVTESKCFRDAFRDQLDELSGQPNVYKYSIEV